MAAPSKAATRKAMRNGMTLDVLQIAAGSNFEPKYRFERCEKVKGICKPFCDDDEYDYGYCIKWRNQCCI
ncbi:beta-defensin 110-like [Sturnira hondurensis]|uniref:beta-defensin 110-like n=1 Tax=Sturnira hondurensis TaxID=192404 RepID=UPI00187AC35C|nr:beta-defensin 110-like [Sturnira hondurensis]